MESPRVVQLRNPALAAGLAWLVPGLGHFYQRRVGKGILYTTCILGLYAVGFAIGEGNVVLWSWVNPLRDPEQFDLWYLAQFFVGLPALPALIQGTLAHLGREPILGGFMAEPTQAVLNGLYPRLGKLVEISKIYTAAAGLLNIFAIYDAYAGPAQASAAEPATPAEVAKPLVPAEAAR